MSWVMRRARWLKNRQSEGVLFEGSDDLDATKVKGDGGNEGDANEHETTRKKRMRADVM